MATYTTNLNLEKPAENEFYDVSVQNSNMDKIDAGLDNYAKKTDLNSYAKKTDLNSKADKQTVDGGFAGGEGAYVQDSTGAAVGAGAVAFTGGAVGASAGAGQGGAVGAEALADTGGAVGLRAKAMNGGAVGNVAITGDGFAGGSYAQAVNSSGTGIDAIQLGTGINSTPKTLQVYDYQLMDESGKIPNDRLSIETANIMKNPVATDGDLIATHLTVGERSGTVGIHSFVSGGDTYEMNTASGNFSAVVGGKDNTVSGHASLILGGTMNTATGGSSIALAGSVNTVSGSNALVLGGNNNTASGDNSAVLGGNNNKALSYQIKAGHYSKDGTAGTTLGTTGDAFIIGNGDLDAKSNCFRVSYEGYVYGGKTFGANAADVAELYEWLDGNPNNEDRRGLFVTLDGTKIKLASPDDTYIKGVISAMPCLVGDAYSDNWQGMYLKDVFGAYLKDEDGNYIINPDYDPEQEYIPREERPEYDYVSNWGKLVLVDDGTCEVNGFAKVGQGGKATKADNQTIYRVMERRDATHIYVSVG